MTKITKADLRRTRTKKGFSAWLEELEDDDWVGYRAQRISCYG